MGPLFSKGQLISREILKVLFEQKKRKYFCIYGLLQKSKQKIKALKALKDYFIHLSYIILI